MFLFSIFVCWCSKLFLVSTLTVGHERVKRSGGLPNHITNANFIPTSTTYQEPQIGHVVVKYSRILPKWSWISSVESYNSTVKVYYLMMPWTLSFILHLYHWSFLSHSYPNNQEDPVVETLRLSPTGSCDGWFFVESRACPLIPKDRPPTLVVWFKGKTIKTYIWMLVNAFCFFCRDSKLSNLQDTGTFCQAFQATGTMLCLNCGFHLWDVLDHDKLDWCQLGDWVKPTQLMLL